MQVKLDSETLLLLSIGTFLLVNLGQIGNDLEKKTVGENWNNK